MIGKVLKRAKVICSYSILKLLFWIQAIKKAVLDNGGEIKGTARHPLGTSDFSSFLLGAQSSGAQVIALANAGADTVNAVKQAGEFGIVPKQVIATPALFNTDIRSLGLETAAGLRFVTSSYPDMDDGTRRWSAEFLKRRGTMPSMTHAILPRSLAVIAVLSCGLHALDRDDHVLFIGRFLAQRDQRLILG